MWTGNLKALVRKLLSRSEASFVAHVPLSLMEERKTTSMRKHGGRRVMKVSWNFSANFERVMKVANVEGVMKVSVPGVDSRRSCEGNLKIAAHRQGNQGKGPTELEEEELR